MHGRVVILTIGPLDQGDRALHEAAHVRRQAEVVAGDAQVHVALVAGLLEEAVQGFVQRRALGRPVVGDADADAALLGDARGRTTPRRVVDEGQELVLAHLAELGAGLRKERVFECARAGTLGSDGLVVDTHLETRGTEAGEQDDRREWMCGTLTARGAGRQAAREQDPQGDDATDPPARAVHRSPTMTMTCPGGRSDRER